MAQQLQPALIWKTNFKRLLAAPPKSYLLGSSHCGRSSDFVLAVENCFALIEYAMVTLDRVPLTNKGDHWKGNAMKIMWCLVRLNCAKKLQQHLIFATNSSSPLRSPKKKNATVAIQRLETIQGSPFARSILQLNTCLTCHNRNQLFSHIRFKAFKECVLKPLQNHSSFYYTILIFIVDSYRLFSL